MSEGDEYRTVSAKLTARTPKAIKIELPHAAGDMWIPRSLTHGADDRKMDEAEIGKELTFRLRAWKADEAGLAG